MTDISLHTFSYTPNTALDCYLIKIAYHMDLSESEIYWCKRWFKMGTSVLSAVDAIRDLRKQQEELDRAYENHEWEQAS